MHPILLTIGPLALYSWGFFVGIGFLAGILVALLNSKRENITFDQVIDISIYTLIFAIIGARIFYVIQFWDEFRNNWLSIFAVWEGGLVFYGGLICALAGLIWYSRKSKIHILKIFDLAAPSVAIGYSIGRIGCFMRGCCFGNETTLPWAFHFHEISGLRHPTQLYSSFSVLLIFILLMFIRDKKEYDGQIFVWGIVLYSIYRFCVEFLRYSPVHYFGLTPSQLISICTFILGTIFLFLKRSKISPS